MHVEWNMGPALIVALGLAAGIIALSLARHARLPGIVLLLATGSFTGFFPVAVGRKITAEFEGFGTVEAMFVDR